MNYVEMNKGYLCYHIGNERHIVIGEIRKERNDRLEISWFFDVNKACLSLLSDYGVSLKNNIAIPGIDLDYGYRQRHVRLPFFIRMRTVSAQRLDLDELLQGWGMTYYDEFELLLRNKGRSLDNWRVLRSLDDSIMNKDMFLAASELAVTI